MSTSQIVFGEALFDIDSDGPISKIDTGYVATASKLAILHHMDNPEFYRHGWNSWSPCGWRRINEKPLKIYGNPLRLLTADDSAHFCEGEHAGSTVGALCGTDGKIILIGALTVGNCVIKADKMRLIASSPGSPLEWFIAYGDELEVFREYVNLLRQRFSTELKKTGPVWSSWYTFFEEIDEKNLTAAIDELETFPVEVIQIDDGWQSTIGDWSANSKFPNGMAHIANYIRSKGKTPGIWLAPLILLPNSKIATEHPEWLLKDDFGKPVVAGYNWGTTYFTFDSTLQEVQDYLHSLFEEIKSWGFEYFKLDFMYAGALPGVRSIQIDREQAYRDAMQTIRHAVGDDSYLLGSGIPMLASLGIFDGARVGPDTAPYWDNTERKEDPSGPGAWNSICNSLNRFWMRGLYQTDPDAVFFRSRQNLLDTNSKLSLKQVAQIMDFRSFSDPIAWLSEEEIQELITFLNTTPKINQKSRYVFEIDGKIVDFTDVVFPKTRISDFILLK
jgi:alpha-galactosidase